MPKVAKTETPQFTREEIRKKLRVTSKVVKTETKAEPKPFLVLKEQESLLAERDYELTEA
ncbi:unnamed protein product, partial [marine sediment metagenome]